MKHSIRLALALLCALMLAACAGSAAEPAEGSAAEALAQGVRDALQEDWAAFDALSEEQKLASSHTPGYCLQDFEDWADCEAFLGLTLPNPLEGRAELEAATCVGMPEGYMDAPHVQASWYGTQDGEVEWLSVQSGYRLGQLRVILTAVLSADPAGEQPLTETDSGDRYTAATAGLTQGAIQYTLRVIGEPAMETEVQTALEKLLTCFDE